MEFSQLFALSRYKQESFVGNFLFSTKNGIFLPLFAAQIPKLESWEKGEFYDCFPLKYDNLLE